MLSPVAIFVYNRPNHTIQTIEALAKNLLANETDVFIFSDAAKNEESIKKVDEVRNYIDSLYERKLFKSVKIIKAKYNKGLAKSVISGVSQVLDKYGEVIVVEDDLVTSKDFLIYMNDALEYYRNDERIWSISGYNIPIEISKEYKSEVYLSYRGCCWGYATWKDRWQHVDWEVKDYNDFKKNRRLQKKFNRGGRDLANMLDYQMKGKIDSWAIRWCYTQSKLDMLTVYPVISRVKNIGLDGTGTHSDRMTQYDILLNDQCKRCNFDNPELNKQILKNFKDFYMTANEYFIYKSKIFVRKILGK